MEITNHDFVSQSMMEITKNGNQTTNQIRCFTMFLGALIGSRVPLHRIIFEKNPPFAQAEGHGTWTSTFSFTLSCGDVGV